MSLLTQRSSRRKNMAVQFQPPLFSETLGFPFNSTTSQDFMPANSAFVPFPDLINVPGEAALFSNGGMMLSSFSPESSSIAMNPQPFLHSVDFSDEFERQRRQVDIFLHLENEKLKLAIQQQKMQHLSSLLKSMESTATARMRKAEHDLAEAGIKKAELEQRLKMAEEEVEAWRRAARENEATIVGLSSMLGQAQERVNWAEDAESVCEGGGEDDKIGEGGDRMRCKGCRKRRSRVVFVPCRHLCACGECGGVLERCPVCQSAKEGCIEVFLL